MKQEVNNKISKDIEQTDYNGYQNKIELMHLLDFILENKNIVIGDNEIFTRDDLITIRTCVKNKTPNLFQLSKKQKELLIKTFLKNNKPFTNFTPNIITNNKECIKHSLNISLDSINYIKYENEDIKTYIIEIAIKNNFILKENSADYLKEDYNIAINSIKLEPQSANFINYSKFNSIELNSLIDTAIKYGYTLDEKTKYTHILGLVPEIVLTSLQKDLNNIKYAPKEIIEEPRIFKYLILNGYEFDEDYLLKIKLENIKDPAIIDYYFNKFDIYSNLTEEFREKIKNIIYKLLTTKVTLEDFKQIIEATAELEWLYYRQHNQEQYQNVFGKICGHLQNNPNINELEYELEFLTDMKETLEDKYEILYQAMIEYVNIYNSNTDKKLEKIQNSKNIISKLSSLYIAKSKENFKKDIIEHCHDLLITLYKIDTTNSIVKKKVIKLKQNQKFIELYRNNDKTLYHAINEIEKKYYNQTKSPIIREMIDTFCKYKHAKITDIYTIETPDKYEEYLKYLKTIKLINRLNNGYIDISGIEVSNYKHLITYNKNNKKYVYCGQSFTHIEIEKIEQYIKFEQIFNNIKKDINTLIESLPVDTNITQKELDDLTYNLPFNDEYFIFNNDYLNNQFNFENLLYEFINKPRIVNIKSYVSKNSNEVINKLLIQYGIIWLLLIQTKEEYYNFNILKTIRNNGINQKNIFEIINNMPIIISLADEFKINLSNYLEIIELNEICTYSKDYHIAILGKDIIKKIKTSQDYTDSEIDKKLNMAIDLICAMTKRTKSTVPYISGKTLNYQYSMYDSLDETILLSGINTDSCFRIDGVDNDFLHYCALDKNGFVIKITDYFGNFIAKASGFRNGNCVYLNQLRTIYDEGGNYYHGEYKTETNEIIETLKKACHDIVQTSQNNPFELNKIDFVFITKSYCLDDYKSNVSSSVEDKIGNYPMDRKSEDWHHFINTTKNLTKIQHHNYIDTDYGAYEIICLYSSIGKRKIKKKHIKPKNVEPVYERKRNEIIITTNITKEILKKINKIKAISSVLKNIKYESIDIEKKSLVCLGDNWYIIYNNQGIIDACCLEHDEYAKNEFETTLKMINNNKIDTSTQNKVIEPINHEPTKKQTNLNILRRILKRN